MAKQIKNNGSKKKIANMAFNMESGHMAIVKRGRSFLGGTEITNLRKSRFLYYSPAAKKFAKQNKGILLEVWRMIRNGVESNPKLGITIKDAATGSHNGREATKSKKVTVKGKEFFLKIASFENAKHIIEGFEKAEEYLRERNHSIGGFEVRIIKPHIVYENMAKQEVLVITDFLEKEKVTQVSAMDTNELKRINDVLSEIDRVLKAAGVYEVTPRNAFYNSTTNTILLFDFGLFIRDSDSWKNSHNFKK